MRTVVLEPVLDANPIVTVDGDGTVLDCNLAWTKLVSARRRLGLRTNLYDVVAFVGAAGPPTASAERRLQVHHVTLEGLDPDSPLRGTVSTAVLVPIVHRRRDAYLCVLLSPRLFHPDAVRFAELLAMDASASARQPTTGSEPQSHEAGSAAGSPREELVLPVEVEGTLRTASRLVAAVAGPAACPAENLLPVLGEHLREGVPGRRIVLAVRDSERLGIPSGLLVVPAQPEAPPAWRPLAGWPAGVVWARLSSPQREAVGEARETVLGDLPAWVQREFAGVFPVDIAPRFVVAETSATTARALVVAGPWCGTEAVAPDERLLVEISAVLLGHRLRTAEREQIRQAETERLAHALRAERTASGRTADRLEPVALSAAMAAAVERGRVLESLGRPYAVIGPAGAGRRTLARYLTAVGPRRDGPMVEVSCRFHDESWLREELFGEQVTSRADGSDPSPGKFELAVGGTLLIADLDHLPRGLQAELLTRLVRPRPDGTAPPLLVATLEEAPEQAAQAGRLHPDLAALFGARVTAVPPLSQRVEDIVGLAVRFIESAAAEVGRPVPELTPRAVDRLRARSWPGHVRELKATIEGAVALARGRILDAEMLAASSVDPASAPAPPAIDLSRPFAELEQEWIDYFERSYIDAALRRSAGDLFAAARLARMDKKKFHAKAARLGLAGPAPPPRKGASARRGTREPHDPTKVAPTPDLPGQCHPCAASPQESDGALTDAAEHCNSASLVRESGRGDDTE